MFKKIYVNVKLDKIRIYHSTFKNRRNKFKTKGYNIIFSYSRLKN